MFGLRFLSLGQALPFARQRSQQRNGIDRMSMPEPTAGCCKGTAAAVVGEDGLST